MIDRIINKNIGGNVSPLVSWRTDKPSPGPLRTLLRNRLSLLPQDDAEEVMRIRNFLQMHGIITITSARLPLDFLEKLEEAAAFCMGVLGYQLNGYEKITCGTASNILKAILLKRTGTEVPIGSASSPDLFTIKIDFDEALFPNNIKGLQKRLAAQLTSDPLFDLLSDKVILCSRSERVFLQTAVAEMSHAAAALLQNGIGKLNTIQKQLYLLDNDKRQQFKDKGFTLSCWPALHPQLAMDETIDAIFQILLKGNFFPRLIWGLHPQKLGEDRPDIDQINSDLCFAENLLLESRPFIKNARDRLLSIVLGKIACWWVEGYFTVNIESSIFGAFRRFAQFFALYETLRKDIPYPSTRSTELVSFMLAKEFILISYFKSQLIKGQIKDACEWLYGEKFETVKGLINEYGKRYYIIYQKHLQNIPEVESAIKPSDPSKLWDLYQTLEEKEVSLHYGYNTFQELIKELNGISSPRDLNSLLLRIIHQRKEETRGNENALKTLRKLEHSIESDIWGAGKTKPEEIMVLIPEMDPKLLSLYRNVMTLRSDSSSTEFPATVPISGATRLSQIIAEDYCVLYSDEIIRAINAQHGMRGLLT